MITELFTPLTKSKYHVAEKLCYFFKIGFCRPILSIPSPLQSDMIRAHLYIFTKSAEHLSKPVTQNESNTVIIIIITIIRILGSIGVS